MRKYLVCLLCCLASLQFGCSRERASEPPTSPISVAATDRLDAEGIAQALARDAHWDIEAAEATAPVPQTPGLLTPVISLVRTPITGEIAHYAAQVRIGPGVHDVIGIHRVVRETRPGRPIRTDQAVFLQHGASTDFTFCYLPGQYSGQIPDDFGLAVYLAAHNVDVWGIDQRWCLVPPDVTNFDFMATWDMPMHIADLGLAVNIARVLRRLGGNGWDQMVLLGFSFGSEISFGLLDGEAQLPPGLRSVKGFIPVDMVVRIPSDSPWKELMCAFQPYYEGQLAAGIYGEGALFRPVGLLASEDPAGESPFFPGLTNYQAALAMGTTLLYGVPPLHLYAGIFEEGMPVGMRYISNDAWIEMLCRMSYVESNVVALDQCEEMCGGMVPWNAHWSQIDVPVFYVTGRGGFGEAGLYQLGLLGSDDVSHLVISSVPGDAELDFGHLDLFLTTMGESLAWPAMLEWIQAHS